MSYKLDTPGKWLKWIDDNLAEKGDNSTISNFDKLSSVYTVSGNPTWAELYVRAYNNFIEAGGTPEQAAEKAPKRTAQVLRREEKTNAVADEVTRTEGLKTDPFGTAGVGEYQLIVDTDENGATVVRGKEKGSETPVPFYIYTQPGYTYNKPTGLGRTSVTTVAPAKIIVEKDYNLVRNEILKDAMKEPGQLDALFLKLKETGGISKETYASKNISAPDFNKALQYLVNQYSIESVNNYTLKGKQQPKTFNEFLKTEFKPEGPTVKTAYDMVITNRQDAADDANQFFMQYVGRPATKAESDEYYRLLNGAEKKAVQSTTTKFDAEGNRIGSTTSGETLSDTDKALLLGKVVGSAIKGSDIDALMKSGGKAAQDVDSILAYARNYGVKITREQAQGYVAENLRKGVNIDATKSKIVEISKSNYKNFADKISDNVSVKELAGNYIYNKAETLELSPDTIELFDADIQDAINGNLTMTDFNVRLRQNPGWAKTKNAREEAAKYATSILESFGLQA
jgi:hypothetical protein